MPQTATQNQTDDNYTPIDPRKEPIAWAYQNREALSRMPEDKAVRFVDMLFKRFAVPRHSKGNRPPDEEELQRLRLQFHARMYGLPTGTVQMKEEEPKHGAVAKAAATVEGAGAGVLGGIRTIGELAEKLNKYGMSGELAGLSAIGKQAGKIEGKAYEDASLTSPRGASIGASVGHLIPATIVAEGAGSLIPKLASGAPAALRIARGGAVGATEGAAGGAVYPGGHPQKDAMYGGLLGVGFPMLGKLFGLGKKAVSRVATKAATEVGEKVVETAPKVASSMGDVAESSAKTKFGKAYKDLTPAQRAELPQYMKQQIAQQQVAKAAKVKAERAAAKAASEAEKTAQRAEKARLATQKADEQAKRRAGASQAVAAQAAQENPTAAQVMATFKSGEGTAAAAPGQVIKSNDSQMIETAKHELEKAKSIIKNPTASEEEKKVAKDNLKFWTDKHSELTEPKVTKVPEGQTGPKIRAKEGKPASPAQQTADRERIAAKRAEAKNTEFGAALEKHAQQLAGKYTTETQVGIQHIPELEDTVREMEGGLIISALQKLRKTGKLTDEMYAQHLKDWLLTQFEKAN